jgi:hypothetical protein
MTGSGEKAKQARRLVACALNTQRQGIFFLLHLCLAIRCSSQEPLTAAPVIGKGAHDFPDKKRPLPFVWQKDVLCLSFYCLLALNFMRMGVPFIIPPLPTRAFEVQMNADRAVVFSPSFTGKGRFK